MLKNKIFALVDCDNFFVSCERLFRPDLENKPVVVLSSNDGCVVARSNEAKALGIPMAASAFQCRDIFERHKVIKFSANFELYGDISRRITDLLAGITPRLEIYSIDESFLDLSDLKIADYDQWGRLVCQRIKNWIGVPVSIGIAPSKTLAKLAAARAKKAPDLQGVLNLCERSNLSQPNPEKPTKHARRNPHAQCVQGLTLHKALESTPGVQGLTLHKTLHKVLESTPVYEVWGVGQCLSSKLRSVVGTATALDLSKMKPQHAQQIMGVRGRQIAAELRGVACYPLEQAVKSQKSIARTRTFGEDTSDPGAIEAALASFAAKAAFRLRATGQTTRRLGTFIQTNQHKPNFRRWSREIHFEIPTADTGQLIEATIALFKKIYKPHLQYRRAGVYLWDFLPADKLQTDLFSQVDTNNEARAARRMQALDSINKRFGQQTIRYAAEDLNNTWQPRHRLRSPRYVSRWNDLPIIKVAHWLA